MTKSEYGVAPIFLKKPRRVVALLHVYFIAIMLSALLERQVRAAMAARAIPSLPILTEGRATTTPTTPRILENFADVVWHEFQDGDHIVNFPAQLNTDFRGTARPSDPPPRADTARPSDRGRTGSCGRCRTRWPAGALLPVTLKTDMLAA